MFAHGNTLKPPRQLNATWDFPLLYISISHQWHNGLSRLLATKDVPSSKRQGVPFPLGLFMRVDSYFCRLATSPLVSKIFHKDFPYKPPRLKYPITHQQSSGQILWFGQPWLPFKFTRLSRVQVMGVQFLLDALSLRFDFSSPAYFKATYGQTKFKFDQPQSGRHKLALLTSRNWKNQSRLIATNSTTRGSCYRANKDVIYFLQNMLIGEYTTNRTPDMIRGSQSERFSDDSQKDQIFLWTVGTHWIAEPEPSWSISGGASPPVQISVLPPLYPLHTITPLAGEFLPKIHSLVI